MNAKHTPGPWHVIVNTEGAISIMPEMFRRKNAQPNDPASYGFETGIGHAVAFVEGWTNDDENARLISAAPNLLAALESLMDDADVCEVAGDDAIRQARAAIAKSKGE